MQSFYDTGILALRGFIPSQITKTAQNAILSQLTRLKLQVNGKFVSKKLQKLPMFQQINHLSNAVKLESELEALFSDKLKSVMNDLVGKDLKESQSPQLLLSFPHKEKWSLTSLNWHLDLKLPTDDLIPGIQAFVLIDDVKPQGGATLALAGSHKFHQIRQHPDFQENPDKFLKPQKINGVNIQIIEMSGKAGDVYLMDLRVLHSPSINGQKHLRMMATNRFFV